MSHLYYLKLSFWCFLKIAFHLAKQDNCPALSFCVCAHVSVGACGADMEVRGQAASSVGPHLWPCLRQSLSGSLLGTAGHCPPFCCRSTGIPHAWAYVGSGIWTQVLTLAQQAVYSASTILPSSQHPYVTSVDSNSSIWRVSAICSYNLSVLSYQCLVIFWICKRRYIWNITYNAGCLFPDTLLSFWISLLRWCDSSIFS